ncbi:hypothetical protein G3570_02520 [Balneolaceae bacterium YR4-1]|uniref:NlpE N-terminal domain-containing protein n=1 Tax=Halalkalibaculum roseum TaxID=2709311 RepID=A0A6M1SRP2_9BACT|nr:copper resistance protein NlpE N-terminal domain-containing protein [Halalkalibaculum roseum]NGP75490.1 hypothetical protein [Halalkalibaculum roseum]
MEKLLAGKSYGGVIPCADCEGIAYSLSFYANSRFQSESMYIGKSNKTFISEGSWQTAGDSTITLLPEEGDSRRLKVVGGEFLLLDRLGEEIEGKLASRYMLRNTDHRSLMGTIHADDSTSIDFKAHGNEPFWGLEIDRDSLITFKVVSGDSLGVVIADVKADSSGGELTFLSKPNNDSLNIALHPIGCMDNMSGKVYDYRVFVTQGEKKYFGCGGFIQ